MPFNSKQYAWNDVRINILGRTMQAVRGVKYSVKVDKEPVFGRGNKALGIQKGNETIEGELMLLQSELEALHVAAKAVNPLYKITDISFDIIISYGEGLTATTDIVTGAEFTEYEKGLSQEDKFMEVSLPFVALDVVHGA